MLELLTEPPPAEASAKMTSIEGVRTVPTVLTTQQGPDRYLGPKRRVRCLSCKGLLLIGNGPPSSGFERPSSSSGWRWHPDSSDVCFFDGPHGYLIAFWRTAADAHAFFTSDLHQAAMQDLFRHRCRVQPLRRPVGDDNARPRHLLPAMRRRDAPRPRACAAAAAPSCSIPLPCRVMPKPECTKLAAALQSKAASRQVLT